MELRTNQDETEFRRLRDEDLKFKLRMLRLESLVQNASVSRSKNLKF